MRSVVRGWLAMACAVGAVITMGSVAAASPIPVRQSAGEPVAALSITVRAIIVETNGNRRAEKGERVRYVLRVRNTGGVPVAQLRIVGGLADAAGVRCAVHRLAPGERTRCRAVYRVRARDIGRDLVKTARVGGVISQGAVASNRIRVAVPTAGVLTAIASRSMHTR